MPRGGAPNARNARKQGIALETSAFLLGFPASLLHVGFPALLLRIPRCSSEIPAVLFGFPAVLVEIPAVSLVFPAVWLAIPAGSMDFLAMVLQFLGLLLEICRFAALGFEVGIA